jgi:MraZ protein
MRVERSGKRTLSKVIVGTKTQMPPWFPLIGEHELTIDDKGRLLVPAEVRKRLETFGESDVLVMVNMGGKAFLYPEKYHLSRIGKVNLSVVPTIREQRFMRAFFGQSVRLQWDKQGRILVSPKMMGNLKLDREISIVCTGDHLELWNRPDWAEEQANLQQQMPEIVAEMEGQLGLSDPQNDPQ